MHPELLSGYEQHITTTESWIPRIAPIEELRPLSAEERSHHVYVIDQTGSDKTTFLKFCIRQDIYARAGLALINPQGDFAYDVVDSLPDSPTREVVCQSALKFAPLVLSRPGAA